MYLSTSYIVLYIEDATQQTFHESPTRMYNLDKVYDKKNEMADRYIRPILAKWAGLKPEDLELTSFYGIRGYGNGISLKPHIDRIDTHVLSVTLSIAKGSVKLSQEQPWPLEVIRLNDGKHIRYEHPAGTMVFYESASLVHGRPTRNTGGVHFGAFIHYKPVKNKTMDWDIIAREAREYKEQFVEYVPHKSTPVKVVDEYTEYTDIDYTEFTT